MRFDDLPRDTKPEARMRTKRFGLGPERVKPLEYRFTQIFGDTRALVFNINANFSVCPRQMNFDLATGRAERSGVAE